MMYFVLSLLVASVPIPSHHTQVSQAITAGDDTPAEKHTIGFYNSGMCRSRVKPNDDQFWKGTLKEVRVEADTTYYVGAARTPVLIAAGTILFEYLPKFGCPP